MKGVIHKDTVCAFGLDILHTWYDPPPLHLAGFKQSLKRAWRREFGDSCPICNVTMKFGESANTKISKKYATIDHIHPVCAGGKDNLKNIRVICKKCNEKKGKEDQLKSTRKQLNQQSI